MKGIMILEDNDPFGLRPIWDATMEVFSCFAEICDRYGLRYFVTDGNAIGIVRHNGHFIPWDDDLDVSMPYPDYLKFLDVCAIELPQHLKIVNWRNEPEFNMHFSKIQDVRKDKILEVEKKTGRVLSNGIFIDVFPIYGCYDSVVARFYVKTKNVIVNCIERFARRKFSKETIKGKVAWLFGAIFSVFTLSLRTREDFMKFYEKELARIPYGATSKTGMAQEENHFRRFYPLSCWGNGHLRVKFEGQDVSIPLDFHTYLSVTYSDYMQLPPESKRKPTHGYGFHCKWWLGPTGGEN